jgi:hypothetical protein
VASTSVPGSTPAADPDILVFRRGVPAFAAGVGQSEEDGQEVISQMQLAAGNYVLEVYDYEVTDLGATASRCMTVSIQGT